MVPPQWSSQPRVTHYRRDRARLGPNAMDFDVELQTFRECVKWIVYNNEYTQWFITCQPIDDRA